MGYTHANQPVSCIIIEIPGNIAIIGVLKVALPEERVPILVLQVNFVGAIEFDKKRAWFFAAMFESRILFMTIEGEMGVLVSWGDDANFVVTVGGFHPTFNPPPLPFPEPKRIAISILNTSVAKIRVEGYFAITSNTAQFGANAELYFGVSAFGIDGHITFDALFRFSPFYFIISISASLSVKVFGIGLFSVRMRGSLEGQHLIMLKEQVQSRFYSLILTLISVIPGAKKPIPLYRRSK